MKKDSGAPAFNEEAIDGILAEKIIGRSKAHISGHEREPDKKEQPEKLRRPRYGGQEPCGPRKFLPCLVLFVLAVVSTVFLLMRKMPRKKKRKK
jgi:hypothetical protein